MSVSHHGPARSSIPYRSLWYKGNKTAVGELVTAGAIAAVLKEPCRFLIARALKVLGEERCVTLNQSA